MDAQKLVELYRELRDTRNDIIQEQVSIVVHKKASTNQIIVSLMHSNGSIELSKEEFAFEPDYFDEHIFPVLYAEYYSHNTDAIDFSEYVNPVKRDNRYFVSVSEDTFQMDHVSDEHMKKMEEIKGLINGVVLEQENKYVKKIDLTKDMAVENLSVGVLYKNGKLDLDEVERVADDKLQAIVDRGLVEEDLKDQATNKINLDRVNLLVDKIMKEHTVVNEVPLKNVIEEVTGITHMEEHDNNFVASEKDPNRKDQDYFERIFLSDSNKIDLDEAEKVADEKLQAILDRGLTEEDLKYKDTNKVNLDRVDLLVEKVLKEHTIVNDVPLKSVIEEVTGITHMEEHDNNFVASEKDPNRKDQDYFERIFLSDSNKIDLDEAEKVADEILQTMIERGVTEEDLKDPITEKINLDRAERLVEKIMKEHTIKSELSIQEVVEAIAGIARMEKHDKEFKEGLSDPNRKDRDYFNRIFLSDYNKIDLDEAEKVADEKLSSILNRGLTEEDLKDQATNKVNLDRVDLLIEKLLKEHTIVNEVPLKSVIEEVTGITHMEEHDNNFVASEKDPNRKDQDYFERIFLSDSNKIDLDEAEKVADEKLQAILDRGLTEEDLKYKDTNKVNLDRVDLLVEKVLKEHTIVNDVPLKSVIEEVTGITHMEEHDNNFVASEKDPNRKDQDYFERIFLSDSNKIDLDEAMKIAALELDLDKKQAIRENVEKDIPVLEQMVKDGVSYKDEEFKELVSKMAGVIQGHVNVMAKEETKSHEEVFVEEKIISREQLVESMNKKLKNMPPKVKKIVPGTVVSDISSEEIKNRVCFEYATLTFEKGRAFEEYYSSFAQFNALNAIPNAKESDSYNKLEQYYTSCSERLFDLLKVGALSKFKEIEPVHAPDNIKPLLENVNLQDISYKLARLRVDREILNSMDEYAKSSIGYMNCLTKNKEDYQALSNEYSEMVSKIISELNLEIIVEPPKKVESNVVSRHYDNEEDLIDNEEKVEAIKEESNELVLEPVVVEEEPFMEPVFVDDEKSQMEEFVEALQLCYGGSIQGETVRVISQPSSQNMNKRIVKVGLVGGLSQDEYEFIFDKNEEFDTRIVPTIISFFKDNVDGISTNLVDAPYKENMSALLLDSATGSQVLLLDDTRLLEAMEQSILKEDEKEDLTSLVR